MNKASRQHMLVALSLGTALCLSIGPASAAQFTQINLATDDQSVLTGLGFTAASFVDPHLINPWGMAAAPNGPFWVSNQGDATSTLYQPTGQPLSLVVSIPGSATGPTGPTGQVFNGGSGFDLPTGGSARFLFANLDGSIAGWNPSSGTAATVMVPAASNARSAIYTGLALGSIGGSGHLYAANGATGQIDVFDSNFVPTTLAGNFVDPGDNPEGLVPFNVANIGDRLFVTYAIAGPESDEAELGSGFVSEFNLDGTFVRRLTDGGPLASPWGLAVAPDSFGDLAGALLVGNFNEEFGQINAFSLTDGSSLGPLLGTDGNAITIPYLWALAPGSSSNAAKSIFFTAGIGDEEHGLFGRFDNATPVPEPATWALMLVGMGAIGISMRRRHTIRVQFA
ncbi:hypothetical protein ACFB49_11870 [Sphingomonas sp. DBB INV C78]|uniref:TIGR03118 family protein n=1 Tax=Sphingomonas sp. DBB INV C78 TaxID=3349434 RepID=UPI0036D2A278